MLAADITPMDMDVHGTIDGQPVKFFVDTGASVSLLSEKVRKKIGRAAAPCGDVTLQAANGSFLRCMGKMDCDVQVGSKRLAWSFIVADVVAHDVIVGRDLLQRLGMCIDFEKQAVSCQGEEIAVRGQREALPDHVWAVSDVTVAARSCCFVSAAVDAARKRSGLVLVEPQPTAYEATGLYVARGCVDGTADAFCVQVVNVSSRPVTIRRGSRLAVLEPVGDVEHVMAVDAGADNEEQQFYASDASVVDDADLQRVVDEAEIDSVGKRQLLTFLQQQRDLFAANTSRPDACLTTRHRIDTQGHAPVHTRPYRTGPHRREVIRREVQQMLRDGIIRESASEWASPVVIVPKKDGSLRFCVDYRKLNAVTRKDVYPLPRIDDTLESLAGAVLFSSLDLASGYWQIPVEASDQPKTAFVTSFGLYEFTRMPFGLCNAPSTFQRCMDLLLSGLKWVHCLVYLDDILVFSKDVPSHLQSLALVFGKLRTAGLSLKLKKCHFCRRRVRFLGHVVSEAGMAVDAAKTDAVRAMARPENVSQLRAFLGMANYYRRFVPGFADIAAPLYALLQQDAKYVWSDVCEAAFIALKEALTRAPTLAFPRFDQPFIVQTDASATGLGAVLSQVQDGRERVVCFASRSLSKAERNYSTTERECLAIVYALKEWRAYLLGRSFTVVTDHHALRYMQGIAEPAGRLARWTMLLQEFDFTVVHRAGAAHANADALSRLPQPQGKEGEVVAAVSTAVSVSAAQRRDPETGPLLRFLEAGTLPEDENTARNILRFAPHYTVDNDCLYQLTPWKPTGRGRQELLKRLVVPRSLRAEIMAGYHDDVTAGHLGFEKTFDKISHRYYWPGMYADVKHWVSSCVDCASKKTPRLPLAGMMQPIVVREPFEVVGVDILGPLPLTTTGRRYVVVFSDYFTKWVEAFAVAKADAPSIAKLLVEEVVCRYGACVKLLSDRGKVFLGKVVESICNVLGIRKVTTSGYHPQTDGLVERFNHTLATMLSMFTSSNQRDWDVFLPHVLLAYRTSVHASTKETPFFLMFGRDVRLPTDVAMGAIPDSHRTDDVSIPEYRAQLVMRLNAAFAAARLNVEHAQHRQQLAYDASRRDVEFAVGDKVWVFNPKRRKGLAPKLMHMWYGPYRIFERVGATNYRLRTLHGRKLDDPVHVQRLKAFLDPNDRPSFVPVADDISDPCGERPEGSPDVDVEASEDWDAVPVRPPRWTATSPMRGLDAKKGGV